MSGVRGLAIAGIVVCFFEVICGITSAALTGAAKSDYSSLFKLLKQYIEDNDIDVDPQYLSSSTKAFNYTLFVGSTITILAFIRLVLHVLYLFRSPTRAAATTDLVVASVWFIIILAGVIDLPVKVKHNGLDIFKSYSDANNDFSNDVIEAINDFLLKLRNAWVFLLLAFLLWIATLVLAVLMLLKANRQAATASDAPYPDPPKNVQMQTPAATVMPRAV